MADDLEIVKSPPPLFALANQYWTSLDKDKVEHKQIIMSALNNCDGRVKQAVNAEIPVANIFAHVVEIVNSETGEISRCPRCVLITHEGETYECVSDGIYKDLSTLIWLYGKPPWNPPILVKPKLIELKNAKNMLKLELVTAKKPTQQTRK